MEEFQDRLETLYPSTKKLKMCVPRLFQLELCIKWFLKVIQEQTNKKLKELASFVIAILVFFKQ